MDRYLTIKVPLRDSDPFDIIREIDVNHVNLAALVNERYEDIVLSVETGDKVH